MPGHENTHTQTHTHTHKHRHTHTNLPFKQNILGLLHSTVSSSIQGRWVLSHTLQTGECDTDHNTTPPVTTHTCYPLRFHRGSLNRGEGGACKSTGNVCVCERERECVC